MHNLTKFEEETYKYYKDLELYHPEYGRVQLFEIQMVDTITFIGKIWHFIFECSKKSESLYCSVKIEKPSLPKQLKQVIISQVDNSLRSYGVKPLAEYTEIEKLLYLQE